MIADRQAAQAATCRVRINGIAFPLDLDARVTLLDALRESWGLTGTKKGCDHGQCGACTVHVDGRRVLACMTLTATLDGADVTTIEGLERDGVLHPVQQAFVDCDALQCGYCTPGQIMSAVGALEEGRCTDEATIAEAMSGNICRCGAYPMIREAIARAAR